MNDRSFGAYKRSDVNADNLLRGNIPKNELVINDPAIQQIALFTDDLTGYQLVGQSGGH